MNAPAIDVCVTEGGNVYVFLLLTPEARNWVAGHVSDDHQMFGSGLAVEWRYAADLAAGMEADGLVITDGEVSS